MKRIVSFLPSATELVCALGLEDSLVGITHECDHPPGIADRPVVVRSAIDYGEGDPETIDRLVRERMEERGSMYLIDEDLLRDLQPDIILTQDLCQVCAPSGNEASRVLGGLAPAPAVLYFSPSSLEGIFDNVRQLGEAAEVPERAQAWVRDAREALEALRERTADAGRPGVACVEWLDPLFASGHWVPEQVEIAGAVDAWGEIRGRSLPRDWDSLRAYDPEVLLLMPCGFDARRARDQAPLVLDRPGARDMRAVRDGRVYAVDASAYFARPGPRVVEGTRLMAHLFHPERVPWTGPEGAFLRVEM